MEASCAVFNWCSNRLLDQEFPEERDRVKSNFNLSYVIRFLHLPVHIALYVGFRVRLESFEEYRGLDGLGERESCWTWLHTPTFPRCQPLLIQGLCERAAQLYIWLELYKAALVNEPT